MAIIVHTRRALIAMRHQRQSVGEEEALIQQALSFLDAGQPIPDKLKGNLKRFAKHALRW